jgi:death on curing protein
MRTYLTVADVKAMHKHQIETYGGEHGLRDLGLLESAVLRPQNGYYSDLLQEAAALMESLGRNHAFVDGNKRIAFAATHTFLLSNGYTFEVDPDEAHDAILAMLKTQTYKFDNLHNWLKQHAKSAQ